MRLAKTAKLAQLGVGALDVGLAAKARVHAHDQDHIELVDNALENADGSGGIQDNAGLATALLDVLDRTVQMHGGLVMNSDVIRAGIDIPVDGLVRIGDHHMDVQGNVAGALRRSDNAGSKREVLGEVAVHNIDMDEVGIVDHLKVATKVCKVGGKNRGGNQYGIAHGASLSNRPCHRTLGWENGP